MSTGADVWALAVATVVVLAPGGALLLALGVRRPPWWWCVPLGPPASVGVATITAMACAVVGVGFGPAALGAVTAMLAVIGGLRLWLRARRGAVSGEQVGAGSRWCGDRVPGMALVAVGVGLGVLVWTHGLGSMATVGQEHDLIVHGVLTAYIQQTGHGAPWQLLPADVLTGRGVTFYPAGLHLLMAATAAVTGSTVVGINAVSAVVLGAGWTSGSAALAHVAARRARLDPALALVAAGTAAIVAAGLYRPTIALVQWGGTVPNAATLALTPGLLAALLTLPTLASATSHLPPGGNVAGRRPWWLHRRIRPDAIGIALAAAPTDPAAAGVEATDVRQPGTVDMQATDPTTLATHGVEGADVRQGGPAAAKRYGWAGIVAAVRRRWSLHRRTSPGAGATARSVTPTGPVVAGAEATDARHAGPIEVMRRRVPVGPAVGLGVAVAGMLAIHPSAVVTVGVSALAWWAGEALAGDGRRRLLEAVAPLLIAGVVAVAVAAPMLLAMSRVAAHIGAFRPDIDPISLGDALDRTLRLTYNAGDPRQKLASAQAVAGALALLGAAALAVTRRAPGAVAAWLVWVVVVTATWVRPGQGVQGKLTGVFYDAQVRVWSHASLFVPTVAGVGLAVVVAVAGERVRRSSRVHWPRWAALAVAGSLALAYLAGAGYRYSRTDAEALASRYARPEYSRVSSADRRAGAWLADRVAPGERVLNSANDGSTLLYVDRRLPIVNVASLGSAAEPAGYRLLQGFNHYPFDPEMRRMLRDLAVRWVYVDTSAPTVSASGAPAGWAGQWLSVPAGLRRLDGLPGLERRFRSGSVSIYHLDPAAIAEPEAPGP